MAYDVTEERLKVKGSEQITRDLKVNRDTFINGKAETGSIDDKGDLKVAGEILAGDDVTISGDHYVNGTEYINNSETAQTTDNYLVLRHNQTTPLGTDEYSGVAVHNYASGKTATITTDKDGTWRVADNTETDTNYTNISYYNGTYYTSLSRTAATVISGMKTTFDEDELDESVYYNTYYYHFDGNNWFPVSLVDNKLTLGSVVTDSATITALNALTKEDLVYFRTLTITVINPVENQPLLTRAESSNLTDGQALTWDVTNQKAVGKTIDNTVTANSSNLITSGAVKTAINEEATARDNAITNAVNALDVSSVGGAGKYISAISETDGKISATATTMDTAPTASSTNAVTSDGIKTAINTAETNAKNLANATGTLAIANGGTGATTAANARSCLGLGSVSTINTNASTSQYLRGDGTWATPPSSTGTVTVSDKGAANASTPVALCTGTTSIGKSTSCALTFNTCTGVLSAATFSGSLSGGVTLAVTACNGCKSTCITSGACTDGWDIYGCVVASDQYAMIMNLKDDANTFIGFACNGTIKSRICADGLFYGNVCGNVCGNASSADCGKNGSSYSAFGSAAFYNKKAGASGVTYVEYSGANGSCLLAGDFLAYWNGAYNSTGSSNLRYFCGGTFGSAAACAATAFRASDWTPAYVGRAGSVDRTGYTTAYDFDVALTNGSTTATGTTSYVSNSCRLRYCNTTGDLRITDSTGSSIAGILSVNRICLNRGSYIGAPEVLCICTRTCSATSAGSLTLSGAGACGGEVTIRGSGSKCGRVCICAYGANTAEAIININETNVFCIDCSGRLHLKSGKTICYDL